MTFHEKEPWKLFTATSPLNNKANKNPKANDMFMTWSLEFILWDFLYHMGSYHPLKKKRQRTKVMGHSHEFFPVQIGEFHSFCCPLRHVIANPARQLGSTLEVWTQQKSGTNNSKRLGALENPPKSLPKPSFLSPWWSKEKQKIAATNTRNLVS